MKYRTVWAPQPEAFIKALAPEPRREIRRAIKQFAGGKTTGLDLRALEGRLQGYMRLRVRIYRIIYQVAAEGGPTIRLLAAGPRSTAYDAFEALLPEQS